MKNIVTIALLFAILNGHGQTFTYQGYKLKMIHPTTQRIFYDTIIFNRAHDTAFIFRTDKVRDVVKNSYDIIGSIFSIDSDSDLVQSAYEAKERYDNYLNYKKYRGYYRHKRYTHPVNYYYHEDYTALTRPTNIRIFHYRWSYSKDAESASGENYITLTKAPSKKYIRSLISKTCPRKNIDFQIEEL